jgi:heme/copper-type cytochrome/quinol oxidase subunit 2
MDETEKDETKEEGYSKKGSYDKRPVWFWILVYIIAAVVIYGVVYYVVKHNSSSNSNNNNQSTQSIY